ncbi:MAG: SsrA-binding protein SmpB [Planctomycetota bacterium]
MAKKQAKDDPSGIKIIARNRKASFEFHRLESFEAGIVLVGTEVKSLRDGKATLTDAYAVIRDGEAFLLQLDIPEYSHGNRMNHPPRRVRKLLLHKREIVRLHQKVREKGLTLVPWSLYFKQGRAKVELALVKGKRLYDKREQIAKKDARRDLERESSRRR